MGQAAGGHRSINDLELARALLNDHASREDKGINAGVYDLPASGIHLHADSSDHIVEAGRIHVDVDRAMVSLDHFVVRTTLHLEMAGRLDVAGILVVVHLVGAQNIVAIMHRNFAGEGVGVSVDLLLRCLHVHGRPDRSGRDWLRDGNRLAIRVERRRSIR